MASVRLNNGKIPLLLDIISVPIVEPMPHSHQSENFLIADHRGWIWKEKLPFTSVSGLCDNIESLWNDEYQGRKDVNDRIPEDVAKKIVRSSLYLIKPQAFSLVVSEEIDGKKVLGKFIYKDVSYLLVVTDPVVEKNIF